MISKNELHKLKLKLTDYGVVEVVKEGVVFTVLITGKGLSNYRKVLEIQELIIKRAGDTFPLVEVMKNAENFFLMILKPPTS